MGLWRARARGITEGPTPADRAGRPALPYPSGWSALAFSDELPARKVLTRPLAGEDVVLYRLPTGALRAVRPYCPHLGAHLGLAEVEGEDLVCPFHLFAFGPDGTCVRTGYGTAPPRSPLDTLPVCEVNGAVFVWRHHDGRAPDWTIPAWHVIGGRPARHTTWELCGQVQEVIENSVDVGHFATLHGWKKAETGKPVVYDGARFHVSLVAHESAPLLGDFTVEVEVDGYGLGCLHADAYTPRLGLRMCTTVMPTAIGPHRMQFRQLNRLEFAEPGFLPGPAARLVSRTAERLLGRAVFRASCEFTAADFPVWNHKQYRKPPRLAHGDGPIGAFRQWARGFYPAPAEREEGPGRTAEADRHRTPGAPASPHAHEAVRHPRQAPAPARHTHANPGSRKDTF